MHEMLHWAAGARVPIVMANVNRALGPGWNVWAEHSDAFSQRDTGWLQVFASTVQEVYDTTLMAFRIAEHEEVLLPVMINLDGFSLSHTMQPLETVDAGDFIPPYYLPHAIDTAHPVAYGPLTGPDEYFRFRADIERSMRASRKIIRETEEEFALRFGRTYRETEEYQCEDADVLLIAMGTFGKEAEVAVDGLRKEGVRAGSLRPRWFRPFPPLDLKGRDIVVIDRGYSFGFGGVISMEIRATTNAEPYRVVAGLGGQEVTYRDMMTFVKDRKPGEEIWFGVKDRV
jgi:pyruvate ferredoxin oxidoreductase alpha subunit